MTEAEIAESIEYEIAIRVHEHKMYLDFMQNAYGRNWSDGQVTEEEIAESIDYENWRKLEAESERNFRKSSGLEES